MSKPVRTTAEPCSGTPKSGRSIRAVVGLALASIVLTSACSSVDAADDAASGAPASSVAATAEDGTISPQPDNADSGSEGPADPDADEKTDDTVDPAANGDTLIGVLDNSSDFEQFTAALEMAGLLGELDQQDNRTVLAVDDDALDRSLAEMGMTFDEFLTLEDLETRLRAHILDDEVSATTIVEADGTTLPASNGADLAVSVSGEDATIGGVSLIATDIDASNGVMHTVSGLILPTGAQ